MPVNALVPDDVIFPVTSPVTAPLCVPDELPSRLALSVPTAPDITDEVSVASGIIVNL